MTPAYIWFLVLIFGLAALGGLGSLLLRRGQHRHELRLLRLQALQEALRHPQLDEQTRTQLTRLLGEQHRGWWSFVTSRGAMLVRFGYVGLLSVGWLMLVVGGVCWLIGEQQQWGHLGIQQAMGFTIAGFALLSLPVAVRELLRRERRATVPAGH